jgi:HEPN domain-containing protein
MIADRVLSAADILSPYAIASRYPGDAEAVTAEELAIAVAATRDVLEWARRVVESQDA